MIMIKWARTTRVWCTANLFTTLCLYHHFTAVRGWSLLWLLLWSLLSNKLWSGVCEVTLPAVIQSQSGQVSANTCHKCSNHDHHHYREIDNQMIHFIPYGELELVEQHQIGSNLSWPWWWCQNDDRQDLVEQHQMGSNPDYGIPTPTLVSPPKVEGCFFLSDAESSRGYFRAPSICPARTSTLALLRPIWRSPS